MKFLESSFIILDVKDDISSIKRNIDNGGFNSFSVEYVQDEIAEAFSQSPQLSDLYDSFVEMQVEQEYTEEEENPITLSLLSQLAQIALDMIEDGDVEVYEDDEDSDDIFYNDFDDEDYCYTAF